MPKSHGCALFGALLCLTAAPAMAQPIAKDIDAYLLPYSSSNNYLGSVLIERPNGIIFAKSYGFANQSAKLRNALDTRYHIASLSILFTSTAVLRLIDEGKLSPEMRVSEFVSGVANGDRITIQQLL